MKLKNTKEEIPSFMKRPSENKSVQSNETKKTAMKN